MGTSGQARNIDQSPETQAGAAVLHEKPGAMGALGTPSTQQERQPLTSRVSAGFY